MAVPKPHKLDVETGHTSKYPHLYIFLFVRGIFFRTTSFIRIVHKQVLKETSIKRIFIPTPLWKCF